MCRYATDPESYKILQRRSSEPINPLAPSTYVEARAGSVLCTRYGQMWTVRWGGATGRGAARRLFKV